jgi:hypothetical protein
MNLKEIKKMKKVLIFCLVMVLAFSMSLTVVADDGGFVSSPTGKTAPTLVDYTNESEDCEASLVITSYTDREQLSEEARKAIEEAYAEIKANFDLSVLNTQLARLAADMGIPVSHLAVSDLFDISLAEDDEHNEHGKFTIKLKSESLANFICLFHYVDGEWKIIEDAEVSKDGRVLTFTEDEFSPFAIVTYNGNRVIRSEVQVESAVNRVLVTVAVVTTAISIGTSLWAVSEKMKNKRVAD